MHESFYICFRFERGFDLSRILLLGGAGYIGSHTLFELIVSGHEIVVVDNLSRSSQEAVHRVELLTNRNIPFFKIDIRDRDNLTQVFDEYHFDCCIHFAGLKAVGESVLKPWEYYDNNVNGTLVLLDVMREYGCKNLVFSSSATVYGNPQKIPITEDCPKGECTNPYGQTKSMIEQIMKDLQQADLLNRDPNPWNFVILRYFNPIGAHASGMIGEDPKGIPNNLMPFITQVASGKLEKLHVFGNDYDTPDGTGVRDYIHVVDLAKGHVAALKAIDEDCGIAVYNLGTGRGYSVLELVETFERVNDVSVPYVIDSRRPGDIPICYSDNSKAERELGWKAELGIVEMCRDSWLWQKLNPNGFEN